MKVLTVRGSPENKLGHHLPESNASRASPPFSVAWDRFTTPCCARPQCGNDYRTLFLPCCCGQGDQFDIPAGAASSQRPQHSLLLRGFHPDLALPSRPLLFAQYQSASQAQILVSLLLAAEIMVSDFVGRWEVGGRDIPMACSSSAISQHSAPSKGYSGLHIPHPPFSSSLDRIGKPWDYAYLQSASSEGLIISHATPFFSPPLQLLLFSAPGWACCMPGPRQRERLL